jgi:hypothetical protein
MILCVTIVMGLAVATAMRGNDVKGPRSQTSATEELIANRFSCRNCATRCAMVRDSACTHAMRTARNLFFENLLKPSREPRLAGLPLARTDLKSARQRYRYARGRLLPSALVPRSARRPQLIPPKTCPLGKNRSPSEKYEVFGGGNSSPSREFQRFCRLSKMRCGERLSDQNRRKKSSPTWTNWKSLDVLKKSLRLAIIHSS